MIQNEILDYLNELFPSAHCELNFNNDYELLINIALSAQTTDKKVNEVSKDLFLVYPNITSLANANVEVVENIIKPLGISKIKSKNITSCARMIISKYNGIIPNIFEELITLPGIGEKTANVFLAVYHNIPTFPVDTHVKRVANRLNLSDSDNVKKIELDLKNLFDKKDWIDLHHKLIFFGRYFCTSVKPKCEECKLKNKCFK